MDSVKKRLYNHMQSIVKEVRHIDPKTGEYVNEQIEIPKRATIRHFFNNRKSLAPPLDAYRNIGVKNLTDEQVESAYNIIKGYKNDRFN